LAVRRGLTIVLSQHAQGDTVRYAERFPALRALDLSWRCWWELVTGSSGGA
jgi:hypothetical protein